MGNLPKPTKLKILEGNRGHRPLNTAEPHPTVGIPKPPRWLRAFPLAVKEWRREAKILNDMGILTLADASVLAQHAYLGAELQQLAADIQKEGRTVEVKGLNKHFETIVLNVKANPKCVQQANLLKDYRALGSALGLDPTGRTRLKVEPDKPASKFMGLIGASRAER